MSAPGSPRLLVIMGSGETSPSMVPVHRAIAARFPEPPAGALLDTPYGFQENATDISARAVEYFAHRIQLRFEVVEFPGPLAADPARRQPQPEPAALARLRAARLAFSGPGSPSYALSVWRSSPVPEALRAKLAGRGAVVLASAAAVTAGRFALPIYEIYKAGQPPRWIEGLDLLAQTPLGGDWAIIPHYDNAEGGTHDTRFCYMGARRLAELEAQLPAGAGILGVDEHTALVLDLEADRAQVIGRGSLTVRRSGRERRLPVGSDVPLTELLSLAADSGGATPEPVRPAQGGPPAAPARPLLEEASRLEQAFQAAAEAGRPGEAAAAVLALDRAIREWATDTLESEEPERARAVLHALIHRLGQVAASGDPRAALAPLVSGLVALRAELRASRGWELADRLRGILEEAGVELRDTPEGTRWDLRASRATSPAPTHSPR